MTWIVTDDTPTTTVVYMAAERIGKAQNHEQLQKICDYLANKNWFQTAGDLRSARNETVEWQALQLPGRLKLAIQQVLDQTTSPLHASSSYGYEDYYAAVRPSEGEGGQQWGETTYSSTDYNSTEVAETTPYDGSYAYNHSGDTADIAAHYDSTPYEYSSPTDEYAYYYSSTTDSTSPNYENGVELAAEVLTHLGEEQTSYNGSTVVEAHAVEFEECVEGESVPSEDAAENGLATQAIEEGTWTCGQCTYLNRMTESFCEMCVGHISLSPDVKTAAGTSVSATLLVPGKPIVEVSSTSSSSQAESTPVLFAPHAEMSRILPPPATSLYPPSAPEFEFREDEDTISLPPPPPHRASNACDGVDFLALAFSGSSSPTTKSAGASQTGKASQMRREELTTFTEYTF